MQHRAMERNGVDPLVTARDDLMVVCHDLIDVERELNRRLPASESDVVAAIWERFNDLRAHLDEVMTELPKLGADLARLTA